MKILLGIIFFHILIIVRSKMTIQKGLPYVSLIVLTLLLVGYVVLMMFMMEKPQP